jgi:hypothetical protein
MPPREGIVPLIAAFSAAGSAATFDPADLSDNLERKLLSGVRGLR